MARAAYVEMPELLVELTESGGYVQYSTPAVPLSPLKECR